MASNHERNVAAMMGSPRCSGTTKTGDPCGSPAQGGGALCHNHDAEREKLRTRKRGEYTRAAIERDRQIMAQVRKLDRLRLKIERGEEVPNLASELEGVSKRLRRVTQQTHADLSASFSSTEKESLDEDTQAELARSRREFAEPASSLAMLRERAKGALLGGAAGEAFGVTLQDCERDAHRPIEHLTGGGPYGLQPGEWAAATAMSLALSDSLITQRGIFEADLMKKLTDWHVDDKYACNGTCIGISANTEAAFERYYEHGDPIAGSPDRDDTDSGSLVRSVPIAIRYWNNRPALHIAASRQCRVTHASMRAVDACVVFSEIMADAIAGCERNLIFGPREIPYADSIAPLICGTWKLLNRDEVRSGKGAGSAFEAALWCVGLTYSFEDAVLMAANLAEDSASVAALTGQLAGALYGYSAIPFEWLGRLAWHDEIAERAETLFEHAFADGGERRV